MREVESVKIIRRIEDIKKSNIKYATRTSGHNRWFMIDHDKEGYCIYGYVCGQMPTSVCKTSYVTYWKTWNGLIRAIRLFAKSGAWGFSKFFPKERQL